jgi:hypothetical protein
MTMKDRRNTGRTLSGWLILLLLAISGAGAPAGGAEFRAGAAAVDITPERLPVLVNGGMLSRTADRVHDRLHARAVVLDDGQTRLAIVVVDSCMMPRELLDQSKAMAAEATGIPAENMLISATHTHSAPSTFGCLGTSADPEYSAYLRILLAQAIQQAWANLEPARVGWAVTDAAPYTAVRRWIRRPDRMLEDPFGNRTVRANMHPGHLSEDATGPSGPTDPDLSIVSLQAADGRPIALLGNFCMHYYGAPALSADYFGLFAERIAERVAGEQEDSAPPFVGIMSHGTSGDIWLRDYSKPPLDPPHDISSYTDALVELAFDAYQTIEHQSDVDLAMAEAELEFRYRTPDKQHLEWAQRVVAEMGDRLPKNTTEVYAREAIFLDEMQSTRLTVQALRIGSLGMTAMPNEVYALTGLKLKALSPLQPTVNIDLANGAEGYIPPPEQHVLGGYNTWPARSAGLEEQAEPKMFETVLQLLERVAGQPRRQYAPPRGPAAAAVLEAEPVAYWRLDEFGGPRAVDQVGGHDGIYESGIAFYLDGPHSDRFNEPGEVNRAVHFAGGRMQARLHDPGTDYSVSLWFWNGMPNEGRDVAGWMFSRGRDHAFEAPGDHLGIGGSAGHTGRLVFARGDDRDDWLGGRTEISRWTWNHVVLVREGPHVKVYLNGDTEPEISGEAALAIPAGVGDLFFGGRNDRTDNFEGKLDEVAVFDRALTADEAAGLYRAAAE